MSGLYRSDLPVGADAGNVSIDQSQAYMPQGAALYNDAYGQDCGHCRPRAEQFGGATTGSVLARQGLELLKAGDQYGAVLTLLAANEASPGLAHDQAFLQSLQLVESDGPAAMNERIAPVLDDYYRYSDTASGGIQYASGMPDAGTQMYEQQLYNQPQMYDQLLQSRMSPDLQQSYDVSAESSSKSSPEVMSTVQQAVQAFRAGDGVTGALGFMQAAIMDPTLVDNAEFLSNFRQFFGGSNDPDSASTADAGLPPEAQSAQLLMEGLQLMQSGNQGEGVLMLMKAAMLTPQVLQNQEFLQTLAAVESTMQPITGSSTDTASLADTGSTSTDTQPGSTDLADTQADSMDMPAGSMDTPSALDTSASTADTSALPSDTSADSIS